jgi:hypothetical protein
MSTETSVEAAVMLQMVAGGVSLAEANAVDLRARIDADTAAAVKASSDPDGRVKALAAAVIAAQRAQLRAWADRGLSLTQSALFDAEVSAAAKLNGALDAAADAAAGQQAYEQFMLDVQAAQTAKAGDAKAAWKGERAASLSYRAVVSARVHANGQAADPVADAALRHAAGLEARMTAAATEAALTAGGAASATMASFRSASAALSASLRASTRLADTAAAYAAYHAALVGDASLSGSVLGSYLEVDATTEASVMAALAATATAATELDAALNVASTGWLAGASNIDFDAYVTAVVTALQTFDAAVQAQSTALASFGSKADVALSLMAQTNGALRVMN